MLENGDLQYLEDLEDLYNPCTGLLTCSYVSLPDFVVLCSVLINSSSRTAVALLLVSIQRCFFPFCFCCSCAKVAQLPVPEPFTRGSGTLWQACLYIVYTFSVDCQLHPRYNPSAWYSHQVYTSSQTINIRIHHVASLIKEMDKTGINRTFIFSCRRL